MTPEVPTWEDDTVAIGEPPTADAANGHTHRPPHDRQSEPQTQRFTRLALLALLLAAATSVFYLGRANLDPQSRRTAAPPAHTTGRPSEPQVSQRHRRYHRTGQVDWPAGHDAERPRRHRHAAPQAPVTLPRAAMEPVPVVPEADPPATTTYSPPQPAAPTPPGAEFGM
jgi:hypothetical protein